MTFIDAFLRQQDLARAGVRGPLCSLMLTPRFPASRHVVFLLMPPGGTTPVLVAKVPRLPQLDSGVRREAAHLQGIQALRPHGFDSIPRVVAFETYRHVPILLETALPGRLLSPAVVRRDPPRHAAAVIEWLAELHRAPAAGEDAAGDWFARIAEPSLRLLDRHLPEEDAHLLPRLRDVLRPLESARLPLVVEHGDLGHPNLIEMPDGRIGVIDWELSDLRGMMAADLFFFLAFVSFSLHRAQQNGAWLAAFQQAFFGRAPWAAPFVRDYLLHVPLSPPLLTPLFTLCWTRYLSHLLARLSARADGRPDPAARQLWRTSRHYALWRHAVIHARECALQP